MQNVDSQGGRNGAVGPDYFQIDRPGRLAGSSAKERIP